MKIGSLYSYPKHRASATAVCQDHVLLEEPKPNNIQATLIGNSFDRADKKRLKQSSALR